MSRFYEETMQSLQQAIEISKGIVPVVQVDGMPAKTYRAVTCNTSTHGSASNKPNKKTIPAKT